MRWLAGLGEVDHAVTRQAGTRVPASVGKALSVVEESAESSKLWCGAAAVMAAFGGRRGRRSAASGIAALVVAQFVSNGVGKQFVDRPRPPRDWFPHDEVNDRPDSSSFPSGHTAAAFAFTAAVTPTWPAAGITLAVPTLLVSVERVQSGAHYSSDVVAGATLGLLTAWLTRRVPHLLWRQSRRQLGTGARIGR
ncbi:phosphatase PAP2 family protein [Streptomyces sp. NPDC001652]|uniref:phosphatase PAP2 family protein n=1 Tax=Streptomyces sp. NPDC001652 TaxID=3154393 RepID=UPI0033335903